MSCFYCGISRENSEPPICLSCDWLQTVRNQALEKIETLVSEEISIRKYMKEVVKSRKKAQKEYDDLWDEHILRFVDNPLR